MTVHEALMPRKIISFDCDGVLAEGGWTAVEDRTNKTYFKKPVASPEVIPTLQWLSILYDIYVVSTRSHEDANLGLRAWLHFALGLEMDTIAGVITGPSGYPKDFTQTTPMDKAGIMKILGAQIHVDDSPSVVASMPGIGLLMPSDIPASQAAAGTMPTIPDWETLRQFLTTPGYEIHGGGVTVKSPCEESFVSKVVPGEVEKLLIN